MRVDFATINTGLIGKSPIEKKNNKYGNVSYKGLSPEIMKNQMKIFLSQDIYAPKMKVKMPESELEKSVLLEILQHRLQLDKFIRLNNEKAKLKMQIFDAQNLMETNPQGEELKKVQTELQKRGNIEKTLDTYTKLIQTEAKKHKPAVEYFENIGKLEDEYLAKNLLSMGKINRFWKEINSKNINKGENLSIKDIIEIVTEGAKTNPSRPSAGAVQKHLNKKQMIAKMVSEYENYFRSNFNAYSGQTNQSLLRINAENFVKTNNKAFLDKNPQVLKQVLPLFRQIESKLSHKINRLENTNIHPIGVMWQDMKTRWNMIRNLRAEIQQMKRQGNPEPEILILKNAQVEALKQEWLDIMEYSVKCEKENREIMKNAHREEEYDYLTGKNKLIKLYSSINEIYQKNDKQLPEEMWDEILK